LTCVIVHLLGVGSAEWAISCFVGFGFGTALGVGVDTDGENWLIGCMGYTVKVHFALRA